jgi:ribosome-interacting GTPase 1
MSTLTNSEPAIADYPFTTRIPQPGMTFHMGIPIQLVDTPALDPNVTERWISTLIRNADLAVMVLDLAREDLIEQWETVHHVIEDLKIRLVGPTDPKVIADDGWANIPTIYLGNKCRMDDAADRLAVLGELFENLPTIHPVSAQKGYGLEEFKALIKDSLGLIRVYSKPPGKEPDMDKPFVLRKGATITELATMVHKDIAAKLKFAKVWGTEVFEGQKVAYDYALVEGDVVELST